MSRLRACLAVFALTLLSVACVPWDNVNRVEPWHPLPEDVRIESERTR